MYKYVGPFIVYSFLFSLGLLCLTMLVLAFMPRKNTISLVNLLLLKIVKTNVSKRTHCKAVVAGTFAFLVLYGKMFASFGTYFPHKIINWI